MLGSHFYYKNPFSAWQIPGYDIGKQNKLLPGDFCVKIGGKQIAPVILGDPAYPLLPWLLKPYPENANTIQQHRRFNYCLSRARVTVENVFGRSCCILCSTQYL